MIGGYGTSVATAMPKRVDARVSCLPTKYLWVPRNTW